MSEDRLVALAAEYMTTSDRRFPNYGAKPTFIIDVVGVGAGVPGHLRRRGFFVLNARAEWYCSPRTA